MEVGFHSVIYKVRRSGGVSGKNIIKIESFDIELLGKVAAKSAVSNVRNHTKAKE